ncbi:condensin complex protein MksE [Halomonadaceae bacterium KBTZ08]
MSNPVDLESLPRLAELFRFFNAGKHLNRAAEPALWAELEQQQASYQSLFAALGYELRLDARGFAWFHTVDSSSGVNRLTRQLALLFMVIFDYQADAGQALVRFEDWVIDHRLLDAVHEQQQALLEAEELTRDSLNQLMDRAVNYGFAISDGGGAWRLLPAVHRYLEHFEELASQVERSEDWLAAASDEGTEDDPS